MDGLDFFSPSGASESYDPAAFERFKEQMKANAAFIAAAQKSEQKQKKKEDHLAKILLKFIQTNQKSNIVMLASRLLQENIPASVVLAIILLGNEELQKEVDAAMPQIAPGEVSAPTSSNTQPSEFSLMARVSDESLPLHAKIAIDEWGKGIWEASSAIPFRVLETVLGKEGTIKKIVIACLANVLSDYFESIPEAKSDYEVYYGFCEFFMQGIIKRLKAQIENQKELR